MWLAASPAAAAGPFDDHPQSHTFASIGAIGDVGGHFGNGLGGTGVQTAGGGELTVLHWLGSIGDVFEDSQWAFGAFGQIEASNPDGHARAAFGAQGNYMYFGAELGGVLEGGSGPYASSIGLHVAPFVSIGVLYLALRAEVPFATTSGSGTPYGPGLAFVLGLKAPIPLDGGVIFDSLTFH